MPFDFSRREFLVAASSVLAFSMVPPKAWAWLPKIAAGKNILLSGGRAKGGDGLFIVDLSGGNVKHVPLAFLPHSITQNPIKPNLVWAVRHGYGEGHGKGNERNEAAEIDIIQGDVVSYLSPQEGSQYFGHGFYSEDASVFFVSRHRLEDGEGHLTAYDHDNKVVADYPVSRGAIHETILQGDGTALAANSGVQVKYGDGKRIASNALLRIDLKSGKVLEECRIQDDTQMLGHFHQAKNGTIVAVTRPHRSGGGQYGKVFVGKPEDGTLTQAPFTDDIAHGGDGECLSIAINDKTGQAVITNTQNWRALVLDIEKRAFTSQFDAQCRGVSYDEANDRFILSGPQGITLIKTEAMEPIAYNLGSQFRGVFEGSHNLLI